MRLTRPHALLLLCTIAALGGLAALSDGAPWVEEAKLTASDGAAFDYFGYGQSVSVSGSAAIVGAWGDDDHGGESGSAYIFELTGSGWAQVAKLTASDARTNDSFGMSVVLNGSTAVVGADGNDDDGSGSGSAYVFGRSGSGWTEVAKLTSSDAASEDRFGTSVDIDGNTIIVGAIGDTSSRGSAYIFEDTGSGWTQAAKLTPSDAPTHAVFGISVALSGRRAIVGAWRDDDLGFRSGSAFIFEDTGSGWAEVAKLTASDGVMADYFGWAVSLSGNTAIVGAYGDDDLGSHSGSAYIFEDTGSGWSEVAKLTASDGAEYDYFGHSVAVSGGTAMVGAQLDDDLGSNTGSVYIFEDQGGGTWTEMAKLAAGDAVAGDYFGHCLALGDGRAIVGAYRVGDNGLDSGAAYIFSSRDLDVPIPEPGTLSLLCLGVLGLWRKRRKR